MGLAQSAALTGPAALPDPPVPGSRDIRRHLKHATEPGWVYIVLRGRYRDICCLSIRGRYRGIYIAPKIRGRYRGIYSLKMRVDIGVYKGVMLYVAVILGSWKIRGAPTCPSTCLVQEVG